MINKKGKDKNLNFQLCFVVSLHTELRIHVCRLQECTCTHGTVVVHGERGLYTTYELMMIYDTESAQPYPFAIPFLLIYM